MVQNPIFINQFMYSFTPLSRNQKGIWHGCSLWIVLAILIAAEKNQAIHVRERGQESAGVTQPPTEWSNYTYPLAPNSHAECE